MTHQRTKNKIGRIEPISMSPAGVVSPGEGHLVSPGQGRLVSPPKIS
jgi:hypothetical protein